MDTFYYCSLEIDNKDCPKKDQCKRYLNRGENIQACAKLYNICNEENNYKLFLRTDNDGR